MEDDGKDQAQEVVKYNPMPVSPKKIVVEICTICRSHIMNPCMECQARMSGGDKLDEADACRIAWGTCKHAFHLHCITTWLHYRPICPLDNGTWEFEKDDVNK